MLSSALNTCAWCREERLGGQGGLTKHWQGCGKCQGEGVAKSSDPSQILWDTCHSPQCFYFNTTLKIWGFFGRRQEPEKLITSIVSSPSLDGFLLNHTLLDPRDHLALPFHFRDGEVEIQREELLPKVTLRTRTQILYFLFCFSFYCFTIPRWFFQVVQPPGNWSCCLGLLFLLNIYWLQVVPGNSTLGGIQTSTREAALYPGKSLGWGVRRFCLKSSAIIHQELKTLRVGMLPV